MRYYVYKQWESCGDTRFSLVAIYNSKPEVEEGITTWEKHDPAGTYFWEIGE
jgi:hypothetical protein